MNRPRSITRTHTGRPPRARAVAGAGVLGVLLAVMIGSTLAGCGAREEKTDRPPLTERQRDSVIGASELPGAKVVERALHESDEAAKRAASIDSMP